MKKILLLYLTINFIWLNFIVSQQYTPLQFKNYTPLWTHLHNTDKIPIKSGNWIFLEQNFYRAPVVIDEGVLYNVYNIVFGPPWIGGYYLEAIDIINGKLLWDHVYYSETVGERRYANRPIIYGDTLELLIHEEYNKLDTLTKPIWFVASARRIILNKKNGVILNSTFSVPKDPKARRIPVPFPYGPTHLYYQDSQFIVINHLDLVNDTSGKGVIWYNRIVLDESNKEIDNSELYVTTKYNKVIDGLFNYDNSNKVFCTYTSETHPDSTIQKDFEVVYYYMDKSLNIITSGNLNILKTDDVNTFGPYFISEDYFIYGSTFYRENPYFFEAKSIFLFDRFGNAIEKIDLRGLEINSNKISFAQATLINTPKGPRILLCVHIRTINKVDFYLSDGLGNINKTNSFIITPERKNEISLNKLDLVGDNILCNFIYRENGTGLTEAPLWSSWVMIKGDDVGILTSNKELIFDQKLDLKISPNPVYNKIRIEFDQFYCGILNISNDLGQILYSKKIIQESEFNFDASHLPIGNYNIQLITDNNILKSHFIKVN
ncbi:MAG: hypothetical protein IT267_10940 [Saprospiraceae bacterium]|nr:hypothetical protein [Saprospiraceae bacterium]